jgi:Sulfotransferase family
VPLSPAQRARLDYGSYVSMPTAMVYMETPKAACTSFKHLIAALNGVNIQGLQDTAIAAKTSALVIHDRSLIKLPTLAQLSDDERNHVLSTPDLLRFCIVRDPYRRLVSAWADRVLCHSLSFVAPILKHLTFPKYIPDWNYLRLSFCEFVDHLYRHEAPQFSNHHWQPQYALLLPDLMNYNLVIRLEELARHLPQIVAHVEAKGFTWPGLPRIHETPFRFGTALYTAASARKVREMYARDFSDYGYDTNIDIVRGNAGPLPEVERVVEMQERNRRIILLSLKMRGML